MANTKLILRSLSSNFPSPFQDTTLGKVLSHADLDNNQIYLKSEIIYTGDTSGTTLTLRKIGGKIIDVDLSSLIDAGDTFTTASTLVNQTLYFDRNDSLSAYTVDLSALGDTGSTLVPLIYNQATTEPNNGIQPAFGGSSLSSGSTFSNILGGQNNYISNFYSSSIVGGLNNDIIGNNNNKSTIGGGFGNHINGTSNWGSNTIGGGSYSIISGSSYSTIGGGYSNDINGSAYGTIAGGGGNNVFFSNVSSVVGGLGNTIYSFGEQSGYHIIGGGRYNVINASKSNFIGGGEYNTISGTTTPTRYSSIVGGHGNYVSSIHSNATYRGASSIVGGTDNRIGLYTPTNTGLASTYTAQNCVIGGGKGNRIEGTVDWESNNINGGMYNTISPIELDPNGSPFLSYVGGNTIGGGRNNSTHGYRGTIGGGSGNKINVSQGCTIGGGIDNSIGKNDLSVGYLSRGSSICGGTNNAIGDPNYNTNTYINPIFGASNTLSTIVGGRQNVIYLSSRSLIGGGERNKIIGITGEAEAINFNVIGGGLTNLINSGTSRTFIGGGENNELFESVTSSIVGGINNYITGDNNFIGGGVDNRNSGTTSSILGGQQNRVLFGFDNTHIIGSDITSVSADTTHVNRFNVGTVSTGSTATEVLVREGDGMVNTVSLSTFTGGTSASTAVIVTKYGKTFSFTEDVTRTINHGFGLNGKDKEFDIVIKLRDIINNLEINGVIDNFTANSVDVTFSQTHAKIRVVIIA